MTRKNLLVWRAAVLRAIAVSVPVAAQTPNQTASDFYMSYRGAISKAKAVEDISSYMSKEIGRRSSPHTGRRAAEDVRVHQDDVAVDDNVKVVKETQTPEGVTLTIEALDSGEKMTGQIRVVKEGGAWKMGRESWSNK